ncbi:MAG: bifunctional aldolase/short-chain dehydrogenase [Gammaproteobacteria bacterium]|nr:bifunctional aldolase/short-chain dehydrogenase [Gammaproteobacteria bacterium]MDP2141677.1 bifunctional aldolase/short-chain dehydrogenase [Gammaproteobacteria bacterium]MDP2347912.1 bifunctional aldolase/short-chain dehydrogenase [Gammaproteobacteria bacterium]
MNSLWDDQEAARFATDAMLGLRVYSSQLLGRDTDLVLHGGGNTSVKGSLVNVFGQSEEVLFVKGSGWDLQTIAAGGFAPVRLDYLKRLATLPALSDTGMMRELRLALLDPNAPTPSVEAILHALIPLRYVDHTHADAVVAISNTPDGEAVLRKLYGDEVLILPYVMPGFILAQQVHQATLNADWSRLKGIVLLHHGIITFDDDCRASYESMIALVNKAEGYLRNRGAWTQAATARHAPKSVDFIHLAALRHQASDMMGSPVLARWDRSAEAVGYSLLPGVADIATRGPLTPDHSIHTKAFAAIFDDDPRDGLARFQSAYNDYFSQHAAPHHTCLDQVPRFGIWREKGMLYIAPDSKRIGVVGDISAHTVKAIQWAEALGGWVALPKQDLFDIEYWELEQAKLKRGQTRGEFEGRVVLVTGAGSGIGKACVEAFVSKGAAVVALDINTTITGMWSSRQVLGRVCDVTDTQQIEAAVQAAVETFGGIDVLVSNAGNFPPSRQLKDMDAQTWEQSLSLNLSSHMNMLRACIPFLELGIDASVVFIGSKNVPAPGPGASAYSVAKAGLAQMARVAALELGSKGIRVNTIHPNAVFDTSLWTDEVLAQRALSYQLTVDEYKKNNVLGRNVGSSDVARLAVQMAGEGFACTTGAQVPVDGGNDRVI